MSADYQKGYRAGLARRKRETLERARRNELQAISDRIYLARLPVAMNSSGWKVGDQHITSGEDRVELAASWTARAMRHRPTY